MLTKEEMLNFFKDGCKNKKAWKIGTEHEKFGFFKKDYRPIDYKTIEQILNKLSENYHWVKIYEKDKLISLKKNNATITLEPGGQIELSGAPLKNLFLTCNEVNNHQLELKKISDELGVGYMGIGFNPKWPLSYFPTIPKKRYEIMKRYMKKVGKNGLDMMHRTTTIQANLDFSSEKDMVDKFRASLAIQPVISAIFSSSPFKDSKLSGYTSYRSQVWRNTDSSRCGLLPFVFEEEFSFERYVDYLMSVPMYFIIRDDNYIDCTGFTFNDFLKGKIKFSTKIYPTIQDWKIHLTTVFPEVRLKTYLEFRGVDGGPWKNVCALPAFWVGLLYDEKNLEYLLGLIKNWNKDDRLNFYKDVSKRGLQSETPDGESIKVLAKKILNLAFVGLERRNITKNNKNESHFLEPLFLILEKGMSQAEIWKKLYSTVWNKDIDSVYKTNSFD